MPKIAKMAFVGTDVGGTIPSPGLQFEFVLSFCLVCRDSKAEVMAESKVGRLLAERTARSLMLLPERFAMLRREERVKTVSGTGAIALRKH